MKFKTLLVCLCVGLFSFGQTPITVNVSGTVFNLLQDTVAIAQYNGQNYRDLIKSKVDKKGNFSLKGNLPSKDVYVLRISKNQHVNLILRENANIQVFGDGKNLINYMNLVGSDESVQLNKFILRMEDYNRKKDSAQAYLQQHPGQEQAVNESFGSIYQSFEAYKQEFFNANQNSPALLPLLSLFDPNTNFEVYEMLVDQIVKGFDGAPTVNLVKANYMNFKAKHDELAFLLPGKEALDFMQPKLDGKPLRLTDLRGKVVLLDFWASWCGPCRRENPNVVKVYEKYKDAGFTVMSVSLDKDKTAWQEAIKRDNLSWPNHVSDLKAWSNEAAQLYKVTGIPFTVLIDKEGKIIKTNARGEELELLLKNIFGF
jgi:thiol-disulfide isomerase/thioredoxin